VRAAQPKRDRGDINYPAPSNRTHRWIDSTEAEKARFQVDCHHGVPFRLVDLLPWLVDVSERGVVDQDCYGAERLFHILNHALDRAGIGHIASDSNGSSSFPLDRGDEGIGCIFPAVKIDGDTMTRSGQRRTDRGADPTSAASNKGDPTMLSHSFPFSSRISTVNLSPRRGDRISSPRASSRSCHELWALPRFTVGSEERWGATIPKILLSTVVEIDNHTVRSYSPAAKLII
jgi:hypothetical protein